MDNMTAGAKNYGNADWFFGQKTNLRFDVDNSYANFIAVSISKILLYNQ